MVPNTSEVTTRQVLQELRRVSQRGIAGAQHVDREGSFEARLLAAIESLKPDDALNPNSRRYRIYRLLSLRYVDGFSATEAQRELSISKSQYYREHEAAIAALVSVLNGGQSAAEVPPMMVPPDRQLRLSLVSVGLGLAFLVAAALAVLVLSRSSDSSGSTPTAAASDKPAVLELRVYAGTGQAGFENGPSLAARFSGPFGLSVDSSGAVFVADSGNQRVRRIVSSGLVVDFAGSGVAGYLDGPSAQAQFNLPNAVTVGPDGTVYVGDLGNLRIRAVSPQGVVSTLAGDGIAGYVDGPGKSAEFSTTGAIVSDAMGNLYLPDRLNNVIRKIAPDGTVSTFSGTGVRGHADGAAGTAQFNSPQRMGGVDGQGNVYVLDTGDNRIRKIAPDGSVSTVAGSGVAGYGDGPASEAQFSADIQGLCVDAAGNLFVMDAGNSRVRKVTPAGIVSTYFEFTNPEQTPGNIKVDQAGNLYLSDRQHNLIYKLSVKAGH